MANTTWAEIVQNLGIGIIGSLIASAVFLLFTNWTYKKDKKKKYSAASGKYIGYGPTEKRGDVINMNRPLSDVKIIYQESNLLNIVLKEREHENEWHGLISMQSNNYGTIIWRYVVLGGKKVPSENHRFGTKQFAYLPRGNQKIAYLIDDIDKTGMDREILIGTSL
ncbi:hypothetical protein ACFS5N_14300 [Mucilaginibacter ximonensis]|uniref:Uncharacterized protein n=1 Tax=Mucilaginibacter ximonensis TaxID=538021 RepID=A0ABW5YED1_9SPHI